MFDAKARESDTHYQCQAYEVKHEQSAECIAPEAGIAHLKTPLVAIEEDGPSGTFPVFLCVVQTTSVASQSHSTLHETSSGSLRKEMLGFMLPHEQFAVRELIRLGSAAERAGFDLLATSDHFQPWQANERHSRAAWVTLGALGQQTHTIWSVIRWAQRWPPHALLHQLHIAVVAMLLGFSGIEYSAGPWFQHGKRGLLEGAQLAQSSYFSHIIMASDLETPRRD